MDSPGDVRADRARGALVGLAVGALAQHAAQMLQVARELRDLLGGAGAVDPARLAQGFGRADGAAPPVLPALRAVPVGIVRTPEPVADLLDLVEAAGRPVQDARIAHAGASAVAMAVSAGIEGLDAAEILTRALTAAAEGGTRGQASGGPDVAARIAWACGLARGADDPLDIIDLLVGTSAATQEAVPAAFAVAAVHDDPWAACQAAAGLTGESETIAALVGAMLGARHGLSAFPDDAVAGLPAGHPRSELTAMADELLALRGPRTTREEAS